jgi:hypothetical protein
MFESLSHPTFYLQGKKDGWMFEIFIDRIFYWQSTVCQWHDHQKKDRIEIDSSGSK